MNHCGAIGLNVNRDNSVATQQQCVRCIVKQMAAEAFASGHLGAFQRMLRDADRGVHGLVAEVGHNQRHFAVAVAQVGVLTARVEGVLIDIHQVKELAMG